MSWDVEITNGPGAEVEEYTVDGMNVVQAVCAALEESGIDGFDEAYGLVIQITGEPSTQREQPRGESLTPKVSHQKRTKPRKPISDIDQPQNL